MYIHKYICIYIYLYGAEEVQDFYEANHVHRYPEVVAQKQQNALAWRLPAFHDAQLEFAELWPNRVLDSVYRLGMEVR